MGFFTFSIKFFKVHYRLSVLYTIISTLYLIDGFLVQDYESEEKFVIPEERVSHLLPTTFQDMIVRVYAKKPELVCDQI